MTEPILIVGAGGRGRALAEAVLLAGRYEPIGFVDDGWPGLAAAWNYPVLGDTAVFPRVRAQVGVAIVAIGNNAARERLHRRLRDAGFELPAVVHPTALVSPSQMLSPPRTGP